MIIKLLYPLTTNELILEIVYQLADGIFVKLMEGGAIVIYSGDLL